MKTEFLEAARNELDDAITCYNGEDEDLGDRVLQEVLNSLVQNQPFPGRLASVIEKYKALPNQKISLWHHIHRDR